MDGIIGKKLGMAQLFDEKGEAVPCTLIEAGPCPVIHVKTEETDGYRAIVIGFGKKKHPNKPYSGVFKKAGVEPTAILREIRDPEREWKVGDTVTVDIFKEGEYVDVTGISKAKGFQGVVKRHGFAGGPAAHGSRFHRAPGSIGAGTDPSEVRKGTKMPGRMGGRKVTVRNLKVFKVDKENNILIVKGAVPGPKGGYLIIRRAKAPKKS